jgi:hypothetical protein
VTTCLFTSGVWLMEIMSAQMIDRLSFSVSGPRHIVTEFQDVGGAGALGEEEGAQACAVHHTNQQNFSLQAQQYLSANTHRIFPCKRSRIFPLMSTEFFLASATVTFL